ncbi:LOW QUALITY PROTEIN: PRAME family member 27 [Galemys pyrenaicus]|uniref:PRAME family member 27 n=1 Tax=Galemys pyrenaicus TaxID=202257 RepID=A0A8J6DV69_GALPY|nr:LOW QUALITY PROTEIN: PRAME family member 27 [Galemys pyrenaicus]
MRNSAIPKLLEPAAHSLLSSEAVPVLEEFTVDLFPPLLTAAFSKGHKKALKELVQTWPFPSLHLDSLIVQWPNQDSLQAVLDGLEVLAAHRTCPRKSELRVLDLTLDFEQVQGKVALEALAKSPFWLPSTVKAEMPQATARPKSTENPKKGLRQPWEPVKVERSCGSLHLCCRRLYIEEMPFNSLIGILKTLDLNFIQELEVFDWFRALSEQSLFATQLGRMCNLQSLKLAYYHWAFSPDCERPSSHFLSLLSDNPGRPDVLLEYATGLVGLKRVLYPILVECCVHLQGLSWGPVNKGKLCQVQAELQKGLQAVQRADMQWSPPLPSPLPVRLVQLD